MKGRVVVPGYPPSPLPSPTERGGEEELKAVSSIDNPVPRRGPWLAMTGQM